MDWQSLNADLSNAGKGQKQLVRPEGFEPPASCFGAMQRRKINDLARLLTSAQDCFKMLTFIDLNHWLRIPWATMNNGATRGVGTKLGTIAEGLWVWGN